jgi:putative transposase
MIREADREPVSVVGNRYGVSEQTIYTWRKRFGVSENARLKKLVAERDLEIEVMKEVASKNVWSAPALQGLSFCRRVCVNVSGLSRASCCCS